MKLRDKIPTRTIGIAYQSDFHAYRNQLKTDFNCRCGYCDDRDAPRACSFEIDHFVPQTIDGTKVTDYSNLVYACKSCNNAKRSKWPTMDKTMPNDGKVGWVDPCSQDYDAQFVRLDSGRISPVTELGFWMYENLKLWKKQHEILWNYERLEDNIRKLDELFCEGRLSVKGKDLLIKLNQHCRRLLSAFYGV